MTAIDLAATADDSLFDWPFFGLRDDVRPTLARAAADGRRAVLATLYKVVGGAPRGIGAQMAVAEGDLSGFLSGGCIEADIVLHARRLLANGGFTRLTYGENGPIDVRLPCGSQIEILLEAIEPEDEALACLLALAEARRPAIWLTDGVRRFCCSELTEGGWPEALRSVAALAAAGGGACGGVEFPLALFRYCPPPRRIVAIGSDPIAIAVVKLASEMGFDTVLIRPMGPATCPIDGVTYLRGTVEEALALVDLDRWTAVALLTHDLDQEHLALRRLLQSDAGYVGALGSRRRIPERNGRLTALGFGEEAISRVRAPIGLPIGGKSPWEIAVSVLAEIVCELETSDAAWNETAQPDA